MMKNYAGMSGEHLRQLKQLQEENQRGSNCFTLFVLKLGGDTNFVMVLFNLALLYLTSQIKYLGGGLLNLKTISIPLFIGSSKPFTEF
jgi:hypothetical protein